MKNVMLALSLLFLLGSLASCEKDLLNTDESSLEQTPAANSPIILETPEKIDLNIDWAKYETPAKDAKIVEK